MDLADAERVLLVLGDAKMIGMRGDGSFLDSEGHVSAAMGIMRREKQRLKLAEQLKGRKAVPVDPSHYGAPSLLED